MWWTERASRLLAAVKSDELKFAEFNRYGEEDARRATVHTREDIVLVVSLLTSLNRQLWTAKVLLAAIALLLVYGLLR